MINQIKSKKWSKYDSLKVFNNALKLYRESLLSPSLINHKDILNDAQDCLPADKRKSAHYLTGRPRFAKHIFLAILKDDKKKEKEQPKTSDSVSESISDNSLNEVIQQAIRKQVKEEISNIFDSSFRLVIQKHIFASIDEIISKEVKGLFNKSLKERNKLQPLPFKPKEIVITPPSVVVSPPPIFKKEPIVEHDETIIEPVTRCNTDTLHIAVVGLKQSKITTLRNKVDDIKRMIVIHFYVTDPEHLKIPRIPAGMDYVFILKIIGLKEEDIIRLLANGYRHKNNYGFCYEEKDLAPDIISWSINKRKEEALNQQKEEAVV